MRDHPKGGINNIGDEHLLEAGVDIRLWHGPMEHGVGLILLPPNGLMLGQGSPPQVRLETRST